MDHFQMLKFVQNSLANFEICALFVVVLNETFLSTIKIICVQNLRFKGIFDDLFEWKCRNCQNDIKKNYFNQNFNK